MDIKQEVKILVIEDNPEVRENLTEILALSHFTVITADDGTQGVSLAQTELPDLILCDVMMPKLDGFGVLNILGKRPDTAGIPFVFLTAKSERADFRRGMNLGADDYITKPFYKDELLNVIETRLKKSKLLKKEFDRSETGLRAFINEAKGYEALKNLSADKKEKHYKKREVIFDEGDHPRFLYFIRSGKVKTFKTHEQGKEYIIELLKEGDFLGYVDLLKNTPHAETAVAMEDTDVVLIPKEDFLALIQANRDVSAKMIKMLANNIAEKEEQLLNLAYNSVRKRVADALIFLSQKEDKKSFHVLREDLARIVGTAKESVIRMLTEFKNDGYIEINEGNIEILELKKLSNLPS
jgi:CRP-like cAMP-binding protein/ActR/RegA family two-component response regulator